MYKHSHVLFVAQESCISLCYDPSGLPFVVKTASDLSDEINTLSILANTGGHENLVSMVHNFTTNGKLHLVIEYCKDGDLLTHLQKTNRLNVSQALLYFRQIVNGLACLHKHGIAHRDMSLENVFLHDGKCKIGDFGLSCDANTIRGTVGKPMYMAPEVVIGTHSYDPKRADIWSLGIILFIMLTGVPMFSIAAKSDKLFRAVHRQGIYPILRICLKKGYMTQPLCDLLSNMLVVDPSHRISIEAIVDKLSTFE
ncbi:kinase [Thraustotheca clavata]|uniref:Kinase n=1 Tax=Thraustotheca clavata TaxID=74557 RepID=A0A1W0A2N0_9STRA|nr:kinase [Thraustotheca clavata]